MGNARSRRFSFIRGYFSPATWLAAAFFFGSACSTGRMTPGSPDANASLGPVSLSSSQVVDGSLVVVKFRPPEGAWSPENFIGTFAGKEVKLFRDTSTKAGAEVQWGGLCVVPLDTAPGEYELTIQLTEGGFFSSKKKWTVPVVVQPGGYASESLQVDPKMVNPPAKAMARIQRENRELGEVYRTISAEKLWKGNFLLPIASAVTSPFGTKRTYNGETRGFHKGLDLKAGVGTPIRAPEAGTVVLAKSLYFTGKTVILDHGLGLMTLYAHLSKLRVKKGDRVTRDQLLGLAGKTGRVNGPHLHWGAVFASSGNHDSFNPSDLTRVFSE